MTEIGAIEEAQMDAMLKKSVDDLDIELVSARVHAQANDKEMPTPDILRKQANDGLVEIAQRRQEQQQSMQSVEAVYRTALEKDLAFQREMTELEAMHRATIGVFPNRGIVYIPRETIQSGLHVESSDAQNPDHQKEQMPHGHSGFAEPATARVDHPERSSRSDQPNSDIPPSVAGQDLATSQIASPRTDARADAGAENLDA